MDEQMIADIAKAIDDALPQRVCLTDESLTFVATAAHSVIAGKVAELEELIDELVERGLGCGAFDDEPDPLWAKAASATGRDPDTGNRAALAAYPERR